jgi:hypothetical protein
MEWNATPELMSKVLASIEPVRTDIALCQALAEDFSRDCADYIDAPILFGGFAISQES